MSVYKEFIETALQNGNRKAQKARAICKNQRFTFSHANKTKIKNLISEENLKKHSALYRIAIDSKKMFKQIFRKKGKKNKKISAENF